jgi:hypothetical protein
MNNMYRLEIFEYELRATSGGREILKVIKEHIEELIQLINHNREVLVTWKRNNGPLFFSQIMGSGFNTDIIIQKEIKGVKLSTLARRMAVVLQDYGSASLAKAIDEHLLLVLEYSRSCNSLQEIFKKIRQNEEVKRKKAE